jgi:hypothetical protein
MASLAALAAAAIDDVSSDKNVDITGRPWAAALILLPVILDDNDDDDDEAFGSISVKAVAADRFDLRRPGLLLVWLLPPPYDTNDAW